MKKSTNFKHLINITYYLLSSILLIALLGIVLYFVIQVFSNEKESTLVPLDITLNIDQPLDITTHSNKIIKAQLVGANATLVVSKAWPWFYFFAQLYFLTLYSISIYGMAQIWLIVKSIRKNKSSSPSYINKYAGYTKNIAYAFFIYATLEILFYFITTKTIESIKTGEHIINVEFDYNIIMTLVWGLIVLLLSMIFKHQYFSITNKSLNT